MRNLNLSKSWTNSNFGMLEAFSYGSYMELLLEWVGVRPDMNWHSRVFTEFDLKIPLFKLWWLLIENFNSSRR